MKLPASRTLVVASASFVAGVAVTVASFATASPIPASSDPTHATFMVSIDEVQQNFVFGERFSGRYSKTVTLSDGSTRVIDLSPEVKDGKLVVRFQDTGDYTFMGPNGTSTNGKLMVQLRQVDTSPQ